MAIRRENNFKPDELVWDYFSFMAFGAKKKKMLMGPSAIRMNAKFK
jgi:hypothetical protein